MPIKAHYRGRVDANGVPQDYYNHVPARDLSDDDYAALDADQKRQVRYGDLYRMADDKPKKTDKPVADRPEETAAPTPPIEEGGGT